MNRYMQEKWPWIEGTHGMRSQLLDILSKFRTILGNGPICPFPFIAGEEKTDFLTRGIIYGTFSP